MSLKGQGTVPALYGKWDEADEIASWLKPHCEAEGKITLHTFTNHDQCIMRLITPLGMRYEEAYSKAYPFDKMVDGMLQDDMVAEATAMMRTAVEKGITMNVIISNRAGGNAPLIAREIVKDFIKC